MVQKDSRIKQMNEILNGIKVLKLYGWESSFRGRVNSVRDQELQTLKTMALLSAGSALSWFMAPYLVSCFSWDHQGNIMCIKLKLLSHSIIFHVQVALGSFAAYVLSSEENILTANKAFVSLSLFNILNYPLSILPITITFCVQVSKTVL